MIKFDYKIIFVFSDPAGGNIISSLIDRALEEKKDPGIHFKVYSDLKGIIDKKADVLVVDVRTRQWYENMHLPGAISLPEGDLVNRHDELPKDKLIIFYCG